MSFPLEKFAVFYKKNPDKYQIKDLLKNKVQVLFLDTSNGIRKELMENFSCVYYINAGARESFRKYSKPFKLRDLGKDMENWAGETWLNIASMDVLESMKQHICDTFDPIIDKYPDYKVRVDLDNLNLHTQKTGFEINLKTQTYYTNRLVQHIRETYKNNDGSACVRNCDDYVNAIKPDAFLIEEAVEDDFLEEYDIIDKPVYCIEYYDGLIARVMGKRECAEIKKRYPRKYFIGADKNLSKNYFHL